MRFEKRADAGEKLSQSAHQSEGCCPLLFGVLGGEKDQISPAEAQRGEGSEDRNVLLFLLPVYFLRERASNSGLTILMRCRIHIGNFSKEGA
ncbi:MAG TPA: hypothetical protein VFV82_05065, partial [Candidatus Binatia bacterium]|nr:hypothetical protein [Candidatus Binatia bacterium]